MRDPQQMFIVAQMSRAQVADDLSTWLSNSDDRPLEFEADDDRLTDEVCAAFAAKVGDIFPDDESGDDEDEQLAQLCCDTCKKLGVKLPAGFEDEPTEEQIVLVRESFLGWSGGFGPSHTGDTEIRAYIFNARPAGMSERLTRKCIDRIIDGGE